MIVNNNLNISDSHKDELLRAIHILENPSIAAKVTNFIGKPVEMGLDLLPKDWNTKLGEVTQTALLKASNVAILTMKDNPNEKSSNWWHKLGVAVSGGVGGFFGLPALAIELPISTTIMLRSIIDVARSQGESINTMETKLACLEVLALGGKSDVDDATESGYFLIRGTLAKSMSEAVEFLATKKITEEGAPILLKFIVKIAERFSIQVTEKVVSQAVPAIGAFGGSVINTIFIDHFQDMAKGHFTVRKLERIYGKQEIKDLYLELKENV